MKDTCRKIGGVWTNLDPRDILQVSEFIRSQRYQDCIEKGKRNVKDYVDHNKAMLSLVSEGGRGNDYALHQLIYRNSHISSYVARLQVAGRRYYRNKASEAIKAAIAPEYAKLPEFFRDAYAIDDVVCRYYNEATADWESQINKAATAYFYYTMREYIDEII